MSDSSSSSLIPPSPLGPKPPNMQQGRPRTQSTYFQSHLNARLSIEHFVFEADLENLIDLSCAFEPGKGNHFGLMPPAFEALLPSASGLCVERISLCAHASGTHTECLLHIDPLIRADLRDTDAWKEGLVPCTLLRVTPRPLGESGERYARSTPEPDSDELVLTRRAIEDALHALDPQPPREFLHSVIVLTSGVEAYFTNEAVSFLVDRKTTRLLVDQPSVDRMVCGPGMPAHRLFFGRRPWASITELLRSPSVDEAPDGLYLLNLHLAPLVQTDAVPSRPVLHRVRLVEGQSSSSAPPLPKRVRKLRKGQD